MTTNTIQAALNALDYLVSNQGFSQYKIVDAYETVKQALTQQNTKVPATGEDGGK